MWKKIFYYDIIIKVCTRKYLYLNLEDLKNEFKIIN